MNTLVNSQLQALGNLKHGYEQRTGRRLPVSFARYTSDTPGDVRRAVQTNPPQVLLTNYVMAELLLVRPDDQTLLPAAEPAGTASPRLRRIAHVSRTASQQEEPSLSVGSELGTHASWLERIADEDNEKIETRIVSPAMPAATTGS